MKRTLSRVLVSGLLLLLSPIASTASPDGDAVDDPCPLPGLVRPILWCADGFPPGGPSGCPLPELVRPLFWCAEDGALVAVAASDVALQQQAH